MSTISLVNVHHTTQKITLFPIDNSFIDTLQYSQSALTKLDVDSNTPALEQILALRVFRASKQPVDYSIPNHYGVVALNFVVY